MPENGTAATFAESPRARHVASRGCAETTPSEVTLLDAEDTAPLPFWTKLFSRTHLKGVTPMKFVLSIAMVAAFAVLAAAQVTAPPVAVKSRVVAVLDNDVVRFRGDVIVKVNGVEIRADDMEGTKAGREFTLRGNVRVVLPEPLTLAAPLRP